MVSNIKPITKLQKLVLRKTQLNHMPFNEHYFAVFILFYLRALCDPKQYLIPNMN